MPIQIQLLGQPRITCESKAAYRFRGRKSWGLLAVLLLSERTRTRSELASLLFSEANDPLRALRWSLAEIRRALGDAGSVEGDPVEIRLPPGSVVDIEVLLRGSWRDAVRLEGIGADLLEGFTIRNAPAFASWLLSEQRHVAAASEAILHEAAIGSMSAGQPNEAIRFAVRASAMNPFDENHQALLIRLYRRTGDAAAAARQFADYEALIEHELGSSPGPVVRSALRARDEAHGDDPDERAVEAIVEAGAAAVAAGAIESGVETLRTAVGLADRSAVRSFRITSRLILAEALVHSLRGFDEEGIAALHEVREIAHRPDDDLLVANALSELGYVDFLRARYGRAEHWLHEALRIGDTNPTIVAKSAAYLGSVESDRANYGRARALLRQAVDSATEATDPRMEAYARSMLGRVHLLQGDLDGAMGYLDSSIEIAEQHHWLAFVPWPQALKGEVAIIYGDLDGAERLLGHAFARACQLGDPCWEGLASMALAHLSEARGESDAAFDLLEEARVRNNRFADPYVWLDGYILDAQCTLGLRHGHADTSQWVSEMQDLTSRTDMKELVARAMAHGARLGRPGDAEAALMLAREVANPALDSVLSSVPR